MMGRKVQRIIWMLVALNRRIDNVSRYSNLELFHFFTIIDAQPETLSGEVRCSQFRESDAVRPEINEASIERNVSIVSYHQVIEHR